MRSVSATMQLVGNWKLQMQAARVASAEVRGHPVARCASIIVLMRPASGLQGRALTRCERVLAHFDRCDEFLRTVVRCVWY